jgi:hypothetical protein
MLKRSLTFLFLLGLLVACSKSDNPAETTLTEQATWTFCSNEFEMCKFLGLRDVRIGSNGQYLTKTFYGAVNCNTVFFPGTHPAPRSSKRCEYGYAKFKVIPNPMPGMGGLGDSVVVPLGDPGHSTVRIEATSEQPAPGDGTGAFRIVCNYSHMNFDDPIVSPGKPGASHLHTFFGNTGVNAYSTASSIANSGNSTCLGGTANRSAYWVPTLIKKNGRPAIPSSAIFYYKTGYNGIAPSTIKPMPAGLRMIAGDKNSSSTQEHAFWGCTEKYVGRLGSIPSADVCGGAGKDIQMTVVFPQCWDGKNLDSADHKSHMAYPSRGRCPSTHPVAIPEISFNIRYTIPSIGTSGWRLSSDMYSTSQPGGFSAHGDWFNGWDTTIMNQWLKNCDNAAKDCHAHLLGDGKRIY